MTLISAEIKRNEVYCTEHMIINFNALILFVVLIFEYPAEFDRIQCFINVNISTRYFYMYAIMHNLFNETDLF